MSAPRKHHFVPESDLKNYTDRKRNLHCFDKTRGHTYVTKPSRAFKRRDLYTPGIEGALGKLESEFARVTEKVIECSGEGSLSSISAREFDTIREFLILQLRRTLEMKEILREVQVRRKKAPLTTREETKFDRHWAFHQFVLPVGETRAVFYSKGLAVGRALDSEKKAFVIGSHPVALSCPGGTDATDPQAAIHMPISSEVRIGLMGELGETTIGWIDDSLVDRQNSDVLRNSNIIASRSLALTESFAKKYHRQSRYRRKRSVLKND